MIGTYQRMVRAAGTSAPIIQKAVVLTVASSIVQGIAFALLFPLFTAIMQVNQQSTVNYTIALIVLVLIDSVLRYISNEFSWQTEMDTGHEIRLKLGEQLRRMPLEYLMSRQAGDLNVVLSGNVNDVTMIMGGLFDIVLRTIIIPLTTIVITLFIDWRLALALLVLFPMAIPVYKRIRTVAAKENRASATAHAVVTANLVEYAQGLAVLRATCQVGKQSKRLQKSLSDLRQKQTEATKWGTVPNIAISTIVQIGLLVVTALGIYLMLGGTLELAILVALLAITVRFAEPLSIFAAMATMFDFMEAGLERIDTLLDVEPLPTQQPEQRIQAFDIAFDNVSFAYATDENNIVLRNVSFQMPAKSLYALVGTSGSGKTTITKLITRYADPQQGSIKIGGTDIRSVPQSELMRHISVVFQDVYLFDESIRNNIRMAKPTATDDDVIQAARAANCHEFITRFPDGYDTLVGEIGGALSGGERQRISIARAILKDAEIVLLDEPTSALDTESEVAVQRAIDRLVEDKTVMVIAHRLSTIVAADTILVVEDGQIVEQGAHDELLNKQGRYHTMWSAQQQSRNWKV